MREARARRRLTVFVAVLAAGLLLSGCGQRTGYAEQAAVPERLERDGTTITVGNPDAEVTVHLYEDLRCPVCEEFEERGAGPALDEMVLGGDVRVQYTLASFLDDRLGGAGSEKAANALRAALEAQRFTEYHEVLYANQPEEAVDGYTDAYLLELASKVPGLRSPTFDSAVKNMKYRAFVTASQTSFDSAAESTPTAYINDRQIPETRSGLLYDDSIFVELVREIQRDPVWWRSVKL
ncbi:thioredoxin domain-containing protein [Streptomyces sp. NPDC101160]|uniref:thioredoxin domain-containing protein n=1 Tax=Streptomyces sp. NPDC101160 TaxID=3366118 RepID=UPI00382DECA7